MRTIDPAEFLSSSLWRDVKIELESRLVQEIRACDPANAQGLQRAAYRLQSLREVEQELEHRMSRYFERVAINRSESNE